MIPNLRRLGDWVTLPFFADTLPGIQTVLDADKRVIFPPSDQI